MYPSTGVRVEIRHMLLENGYVDTICKDSVRFTYVSGDNRMLTNEQCGCASTETAYNLETGELVPLCDSGNWPVYWFHHSLLHTVEPTVYEFYGSDFSFILKTDSHFTPSRLHFVIGWECLPEQPSYDEVSYIFISSKT